MSKKYRRFIPLCFLSLFTSFCYAAQYYEIRGTVIDRITREPVPYASVAIWNSSFGSVADSIGQYRLVQIPPGIYRIQVSCLGYQTYTTPEFKVTTHNLLQDIELTESKTTLEEVSVTGNRFRHSTESPIAMRVIGVQEIEKSPGANRDISKVVSSFPGVASTVGNGYRNDLLVRGGGPMENRFFLDGVEIPNINHFSTQGASGGPMGIIDADFIREVSFYTGAFPANRGNALSSVLDFQLLDGSMEKNSFKFTLGASEAGFSSNGHIGKKTTYLVSVRQSYLQLLFMLLKMPFLPQYTDAQFKVKTRFSDAHELTILGIGGIDRMSLNKKIDEDDESKQYILSYIPKITQNTYTVGAVYKHYGGAHLQTVVVSHNFLNNKNVKYRDNDESSIENRMLYLNSDEAETHFRFENRSTWDDVGLNVGANLDYATYFCRNTQKIFTDSPRTIDYRTHLGILKWGVFGTVTYEIPRYRFSAAFGFRLDGNSYSARMSNPLRQFSPRLSLSYGFSPQWYVNANIGRYYQLPAYTTLGYKEENIYINKRNGIEYIRSDQAVAGVEYQPEKRASITLEGFYKKYDHSPLSLTDSIPLSCKGTDYGASGSEPVASTATGHAYGVELMIRWYGEKFNLLASYTWFRSEYKDPRTGKYIPSAWDNQHLATVTGTYRFPYHWDLGLKLRVMGGTPYTPYDLEKSSITGAWDATSRPYYNYSKYNSERLGVFTQTDIRLDKSFYLKGWMIGIYIDLQNVLNLKYNNPAVYVKDRDETYIGEDGQEHYVMKRIAQKSGTILPTLGVTIEF